MPLVLPDPAVQAFIDRPPGHARVLGPPGSGKTTLLVERWRALAARGHRPGIVAFGREQQERLLDLVLPPGGAHLGPLPVTTHALLASAVLDADRPGRPRTLRDVDELLVLGRLIRREPALLSSDLAAISHSATFMKDLLEAIHALAQHGLDPGAAQACARSADNARVRDVLTVYRRYREACAERGLVTFYDAAWRAAERFDAGGIASPLWAFDVVLIDDFHDLDPGQYRLLTRLLPPDGATKMEVFGDPTGARFGFRGTSDRALRERVPRDYATADLELGAPRSGNVALDETIASLIEQTTRAAFAPPAQPAADLPLFAQANAPARSTHAARPAWKCAATFVITDDEIAEAQAVAARARAALDAGTTPRDIAVIARDPARYRSALSLACHEWGVPLDAGGDGDGAAEDLVRTLLGALGTDHDGRFAEAFHPPLGDAHGDVSTWLRTLKHDYAQGGGAFDLTRMIDERIRPLFPKGDTASHAVLAAVVDEWRRYHEVVTHAGGGASLDEFRTHYLRENTTRRRGGNKVRLLSARESSGRMFQMAFVCGCAEGYFPGAGVQDGYISMAALARALEAADREAAADLAARVDETEVERTEHALFLTALTRARDALVLLAPAKIGGESTLPARVLEAAAPPFARDAGTRTPSPCARAAQAVAIASPDRALVDRLRPLDVLAAWWTSPPALERFPALGEFSMSASKLNSYARCARQFFYRNVLKLDEPESIYLRVGSLVHDALKEIIPEGATRDEIRAALRNARAREIAERLVGEAMREEGVWMRELSVKYLEDMLAHVAELEALREGDYRVLKREEEVKADIGGMPLRGRMDRVDEVEGLGPLIIDYKTSGSINKTYTTLVEKLETDYWQIPVYAAMAAANDLAPGGFVYYALPPGEESFAAGVQLAPGRRPAPIPLGRSRSQARYGPVEAATVAAAMARAVEIHRTIIEGECRYERTEDTGICPNCHFAAICQRSRASL